jgi:hypothetical protein
MERAARRPAFRPLGSERGRLLPDLDHALTRYVAAWQAARLPEPIPSPHDHSDGIPDYVDARVP